MTAQGIENLNFELALTRLEALVRKLEEGNISLEEGLAAFEEGTALSRLCQQRLDQAEKRIEELMEQHPPTGGTSGS
ncbi:MAG: exodeoxyribonuclease VII small subunit [Magnetococcales bacterium]|nr:exodeoxyribonuclease VII small subunit [Magnetococcales bacterium]MBF0149646.1 exodeoxyribonuclease VII small subunit [Magnetococcales bacterium]MBF0172492.1 exodeoxyribonuclease VII small subunit [Magnetococcales bacterium]MBF0348542.1 exodeoxyribonuclease VII small subunit [Magnetococcales bacterium]MBF0631789.1 exodeoxyribonuclease VII small subunit [Magnetococcales bacterium]